MYGISDKNHDFLDKVKNILKTRFFYLVHNFKYIFLKFI